jgi:hypothetical protein
MSGEAGSAARAPANPKGEDNVYFGRKAFGQSEGVRRKAPSQKKL